MHDTNLNNFGKVLEDKLYQKLVELGSFGKIVHEEGLKREMGWRAASVDYLIDIGDAIIMMQCKWRRSRRRENKGINNFLESINYITSKCGKPLIFGMWISRIYPFDDNVEKLQGKNIYCVSDYDSIDWLVEKTAEQLTALKERYGSSC